MLIIGTFSLVIVDGMHEKMNEILVKQTFENTRR
jgi:hypothetical protein